MQRKKKKRKTQIFSSLPSLSLYADLNRGQEAVAMLKGALPARGSSLYKEIQRGAKEET